MKASVRCWNERFFEEEGITPINLERSRLWNIMMACKCEQNMQKREKAYNYLIERFDAYKKHFLYMLYGIYGADELKKAGYQEEDMIQEMNIAILNAVNHWEDGYRKDLEHETKSIYSYISRWIEGELKRNICCANGYSTHYVDWLVYIKNNGLQLDSPDGKILECIRKRNNCPKNPEKLLQKLREIFCPTSYSKDESYMFEDEILDDMVNKQRCSELIEYVSKYLNEEELEIFNEFYIDEQNAKTIRRNRSLTLKQFNEIKNKISSLCWEYSHSFSSSYSREIRPAVSEEIKGYNELNIYELF